MHRDVFLLTKIFYKKTGNIQNNSCPRRRKDTPKHYILLTYRVLNHFASVSEFISIFLFLSKFVQHSCNILLAHSLINEINNILTCLFYIPMKIVSLPFRKLYLSTTKINFTIYYCIAPSNMKTGAQSIYLGAELLEHRICASSISLENTSFPNSFFQFTFPPAANESCLASHPCQHLVSSDVSILYNLMSVKWYFIFIIIYIP